MADASAYAPLPFAALPQRVDAGQSLPGGTDAVTLSVERIYTHHTERQSYHFLRQADGWRIYSVGAVEKRQPPVPYGSPVFDLTAGNK